MNLLHTAHIPSGEGPFPTILALHGIGADAHDLLGLAPYLHGGRALVLCPEGPVTIEAGPGMVGHAWFPFSGGGPLDPATFDRGADALRGFLDEALAVHPIDPRRIVLLGFSQGGAMAYDLALRQPERFAGLVALSSWLPSTMLGSVGPVPAHAGLPALVVHGTKDDRIPLALGHESRDRLLELGLPTTFLEFEMAHEIQPEALRSVVEWLDEKVFQPAALP